MQCLYSTLVQLDDSKITWSIFMVRNNELPFWREKLSLTEKTIGRLIKHDHMSHLYVTVHRHQHKIFRS